MRILILGARGQVGHELLRSLGGHGEIIPLARQRLPAWPECVALDLTQRGQLRAFLDRQPVDLIVNAAAWTAVDAAEQQEQAAAVLNHQLPADLADYAARRCCRLIHLSTDYVFDGLAESAYREDAPTNPNSAYGRTKLAGEQAVLNSAADAVVIRASWVYSARRHNFVRAMLTRAMRGQSLRVVADQHGCPTWARDIADGVAALVAQWPDTRTSVWDSRLYHLAGHDQATWHEFAGKIVEYGRQFGMVPAGVTVTPITTKEYPTPAARPAWSVLDSSLFSETFGYRAGGWSSLYLCLEELKEAQCWFQ